MIVSCIFPPLHLGNITTTAIITPDARKQVVAFGGDAFVSKSVGITGLLDPIALGDVRTFCAIQEPSGFTNKTAAQRVEAKREADLLDGRAGFSRKAAPPRFEDAVETFKACLKPIIARRHTNCTN
jgi:hypothetical protein